MAVYQFLLHRCGRGHHHYHIVFLPKSEAISPPFSSLAAGQQLVKELGSMVDDDPVIAKLERREITRILREIEALAQRQRRHRGRFIAGQEVSRDEKILRWEGYTYTSWRDFVSGANKSVGFVDQIAHRDFFIPLRCDFVDRPGEDETNDLRKLEKLPSRIKSFQEMGFNLKRIK